MSLSVETFLKLVEQEWSRIEILKASSGLRDLQLRWDNKRQLTHTVNDGQVSIDFSVDLDDSDKAGVRISNSSFDPSNSYNVIHNTTYFSLSKEQLKNLGRFIYFSSLEPDETLKAPH